MNTLPQFLRSRNYYAPANTELAQYVRSVLTQVMRSRNKYVTLKTTLPQ